MTIFSRYLLPGDLGAHLVIPTMAKTVIYGVLLSISENVEIQSESRKAGNAQNPETLSIKIPSLAPFTIKRQYWLDFSDRDDQ